MTTVLVVDDKELMRDSVAVTLERAGFGIATAPDAQTAMDIAAKNRPDCVVTDMRMPGLTGIELVQRLRRIDDELPVIVMTAFGTIDTAVRAMREGAFDYLTKPFEGDELVISVKRAIEHRRVSKENAVLRAGQAGPSGTAGIPMRIGVERLIGSSAAIQRVREQIASLAGSAGTVLITGESGVGKEVVARAIHECGQRRDGPFLAMNCAALSASLLESELFGHERGSFTGADRLRKGRFELADRGTLLLDEISEVSPQVQAKLLRVLQERAFERVGSSLTIGVDVRVVATSNRDLPASVARNEFRQDLYFRLNVLPIRVPTLRERREDVPTLARHFIAGVCAREGRPALELADQAAMLMSAYNWPGNVRELQNICERAVVLTGDRATKVIQASMIEPWLSGECGQITNNNAHHMSMHANGNQSSHVTGHVTGHVNGHAAPLQATPLRATVRLPGQILEAKPDGQLDHGLGNGVHGIGNGHVHASGNSHPPGLSSSNSSSFGGTHAVAHAVQGGFGTSMGNIGGALSEGPIRTLEEIERETIVAVLVRFKGHRQKTAAALGIGVRTLGLKLKKWKEQRLVAETL